MAIETGRNLARVYLVRHGETQDNIDKIIQGHRNSLLNDRGREQACCLGEALKDLKFRTVFSSDLSRAVETAEAVLKHHPDLELIKQEELRERFMGCLQSVRWKPGLKMVDGVDEMESNAAFSKRAVRWWDNTILAGLSTEDNDEQNNLLVVSHGGFIGTLVKTLIGRGQARCGKGVIIYQCLNTSVTIIDIKGDRTGVIIQYSDVAHLNEETNVVNADIIEGST